MFTLLSTFIPILLLALPNMASCDEIPSENGVLILTEQNFAQVVQDTEFVLVMFSGAKCGYCQRMMPAYEAAAEELATEQPTAKLAKVNVSTERSFIQEYEIKTVPDVRAFRGGKLVEKYQGERTKESIVEYVKGKMAEKED